MLDKSTHLPLNPEITHIHPMCELIDFLLSKKERQTFSPKTSGRSIYCHQFSLIQKSFRFGNLPKNFPTFFFSWSLQTACGVMVLKHFLFLVTLPAFTDPGPNFRGSSSSPSLAEALSAWLGCEVLNGIPRYCFLLCLSPPLGSWLFRPTYQAKSCLQFPEADQ